MYFINLAIFNVNSIRVGSRKKVLGIISIKYCKNLYKINKVYDKACWTY